MAAREMLYRKGAEFFERADAESGSTESALRIYKNSPETVAIQIRGSGPLVNTKTYNRSVKRRELFAQIELRPAEIDEAIVMLEYARDRIRNQAAA